MIAKLNRLFCTITSTMVQILNVAEKNDAARTLAEIMSAGRYNRREGISKFNKIYEYQYNILNRPSSMVMTSLSGHLMNYEFVALYKNWNGCNPVSLFDAPMQKACLENYVDIKRTLEREVRRCEILIIWTDCDREGENIGFEIVQVCKNVKPHIRVYRARFSEITPQSVTNACNNLTTLNENTSDAVDVRQELDLRIGASFTRFQTLRLQKIFPQALADQLISYGSCQFPTLGFVVERYQQVQAFVPETFWKIKVSHQTEEGEIEFHWKRVRLFDHTACLILYQICLENPIATVIHIESRTKSKWRPLPLETVELEKTASRKLYITAKETMKIAEKLYTQGYISYPRTETNIFPKDLDLNPVIQMQTVDQNWGEFATNLLNVGPTPRNGTKTDNAHPPIYPTKYANHLQGKEKQVYEFIVRHFLACCSQDAQGKETTVKIDIAGETFTAQGLMIIARNYLDVYPYDRWNAKVIPVFEMGESFQPSIIQMVDGDTSPPPLLTEADLIALMEKHGIGTDATYAEHIETIKSRMYVGVRDDGRFVPGELGMGLVEGYNAMGQELSKPHLRAELEADLKRICEGVKNKNDVLREQIDKYRNLFIQAANMANKIDEALSQYLGTAETIEPTANQTQTFSPVRKCPQCNQDMVLMKKTNKPGFYISCVNFPKCRTVIWLPEAILEASVTRSTCEICEPQPVYLLKLIFKRNSVPPFVPLEYIGCVSGCDEMLQQYFNIQLHCSPPDNVPTNRASNQSRSSVRGGRGRASALNQSRASGPVNHSRTSEPVNQSRMFEPAAQPRPSGLANVMRTFGSTNHSINQPQINNRNSSNNFRINDNLNDHTFNNGIQAASHQEINRQSLRNVNHHPSSSGEGEIVCNCGDNGLLLTVKKEGPNLGRQFYKCAKPQGSGCNFFLWADSTPVANPNENRFPNNNFRTPSHQPNSTSLDQGAVVCNCGEDALLLTVKKEGANLGRQFYKCAKPQGTGCNFFLWADSAAGQNSENNNRFVNNNDTRNNFAHSSSSNFPPKDSSGIVCNCKQSSIRVTVQKEGPNKGRQFFSCPKPFGEKCNFFKWADDETDSHFAGQNSSANFSYADQEQTRQNSVKKRKCGVCGQEGHNKRNCPVANS